MSLAFVLLAAGVLFLPVADQDGKFAVIGLVLAGASIGLFRSAAGLLRGDATARNVVSGLMAAYVVAILLAEPAAAGLFAPIALAGTTVGLLWLPKDAQAFFAPTA